MSLEPSQSGDRLVVKIADLKIGKPPFESVVTHSLGSCVGVAIYDPTLKVGGILHFMLPAPGADSDKSNPARFGMSGIPELFRKAYAMGCSKSNLIVTVAGGSGNALGRFGLPTHWAAEQGGCAKGPVEERYPGRRGRPGRKSVSNDDTQPPNWRSLDPLGWGGSKDLSEPWRSEEGLMTNQASNRILIVDDSMLIRKVTSKAAKMAGFEPENIFEAENGQQAIDVAAEVEPSIILLDIHMPVMNGEEFMEDYANRYSGDGPSVVIVSTEVNIDRLTRLRNLGAVGRLKKPFQPQELAQLIETIQEERGAA